MAKMIICSKCGRERRHQAKGMCAPCYVAEYKKKNSYDGPIGICIDCLEEKPIHSKKRCRQCYNKYYRSENLEKEKIRQKKYRESNIEKVKENQREWRANNKEYCQDKWKGYYEKNKERLAEKSKVRYDSHKGELLAQSKEKRDAIKKEKLLSIQKENVIEEEQILAEYLVQIPDMKRVLIKEFLDKHYRDRKIITKKAFLKNILILLSFLKERFPDKYYGSWSLLEGVDVELCQVERGILKDSVRVFFKWLNTRKGMPNITDSIPAQTCKKRISTVPTMQIRELYIKWNSEECNLVEKIVGLLIMYYGLTNEELRYLKDADISDGFIFLDGEKIEIEEKLNKYIQEYQRYKYGYFLGVSTEYFFATIYSAKRGTVVDISYFSKLFKRNNVMITPSNLRKAMIYIQLNVEQTDPFLISNLFRISPRGAARYFE